MLFYIVAFCAHNTMDFDFSCKLSILKKKQLETISPEESDAFVFMSSSASWQVFHALQTLLLNESWCAIEATIRI